jgi:hypothetical protein
MIKNYAELIREILASETYLERLKYIHNHYQNVKCEGRYRDAFLEEIKTRHGDEELVAYAEVDKVDLVLVDPKSDDRIRIEFKYQYTADMAYSVANKVSDFDALRVRVAEGGRGVAELILADCEVCDFFILVVQDRTGHPEPGMLPGKVGANFIGDQRKLDREFGAGSDQNKRAWLEPTRKLLDCICDAFGGAPLEPIPRAIGAAPNPLTSHFFVLDMTGRKVVA